MGKDRTNKKNGRSAYLCEPAEINCILRQLYQTGLAYMHPIYLLFLRKLNQCLAIGIQGVYHLLLILRGGRPLPFVEIKQVPA